MDAHGLKTEILGEDAVLEHRKVTFENGGKWRCETCDFEEPCIIAWKPISGGDTRLSCHECHLYEDPLRYRNEVALAYLPTIPQSLLAHLVRLTLATSRATLGTQVSIEARACRADRRLKKLLEQMLGRTAKSLDSHDREKLLVTKVDDAIKELTNAIGSNIGHGLKFGQSLYPDRDMTLRVLAHGTGPEVDELAVGLRLIPKSIRWSRTETWTLGLAAGLFAEIVSFANANITTLDAIEEEAAEAPEVLLSDDGIFVHAPVDSNSVGGLAGGDE